VATQKQVRAAKRNVQKAQQGAKRKRTIANLPKSTRTGLGEQAARARRRGGAPGRALEDRNREQLYELAKQKDIAGRSKMGKWELIDAIRKAG
jgi:hypothetical protein